MQIAAIARAASAALDEAREEGRLPLGAVFAVRVAGGPADPLLRVLLERAGAFVAVNAYRIGWELRNPGAPVAEAPGRCRPLLSAAADEVLGVAHGIVARFAAGITRLEVAVADALLASETEAMKARLAARPPVAWRRMPPAASRRTFR